MAWLQAVCTMWTGAQQAVWEAWPQGWVGGDAARVQRAEELCFRGARSGQLADVRGSHCESSAITLFQRYWRTGC
jgi:hypothetical protein